MLPILVAGVACLAYVGMSLLTGDFFPFSRYSMYASIAGRDQGAVLYVRVGDHFLAPDDLDAVYGLDVPALDPTVVPCSQQWVVYEAQRWFQSRAVPQPPLDAVPVEVGYRMLHIGDGFRLEQELQPVTTGLARLRH